MKRIILAGAALGAITMMGCDVYETSYDPYRPEPVVYETYYRTGYYDGPYWVYRDHDGRYYHELREEHERREHQREHWEHEHGDRGEWRGGERHAERPREVHGGEHPHARHEVQPARPAHANTEHNSAGHEHAGHGGGHDD